MGRYPTRIGSLAIGYKGPRYANPYRCEWGIVVGDRVRRLRRDRGQSLERLSAMVRKPEGGHYSGGYFSRLERGWSSAPLFAYIGIAEALEVGPGRLLGSDDAHKVVSDAEMTLLLVMREAGVAPHEAIAHLARWGR